MATKQKGVWDISIEINGQQVKNNLRSIGSEIGKLNADLKKLTPGTDEFIKKSNELNKAKKAYKDINDEIRGTNVSLQEAQGHFSNLFGGVIAGDFKMVQSGLQGITGNIKGMTKSALAFIATPIGIAIAALAGIAFAAKEWVNYNIAAREANQLTQELTQLTGEKLDEARIRAQTLQEIFGIEFKQSLDSAKSLVVNFGISYKEAFDIIESSAVTGKHKNNEFLDSLKEYPVQFKNAGFSAKEFVNIVNAGIDLSIYSDKLPDAIKEFTLSVLEQTTASKDALTNAFGEQFTNQLFTSLKNGSITAKDALQLISKEAETIGLNSQQAQQLTADLFRGAGEDAGGALVIFKAVNEARDYELKQLTPLQQETARLAEATTDLNTAKDNALKSDSFSKFSNDISIVWKNIQAFFYQSLEGLVWAFQDWWLKTKLVFSDFSIAVTSLPVRFTTTKNIIVKAVGEMLSSFRFLGDAFKSITTLDFNGVKVALSGFSNSIKNTASTAFNEFGKVDDVISKMQANARTKIVTEFQNSKQGAGEMAELPKEGEEKEIGGVMHVYKNGKWVKKQTTTTKTGGGTSGNDKDKEQERILKEKENAEKTLTEFIKKQQEERLLSMQTGLEKELSMIDAKYQKEIDKAIEHGLSTKLLEEQREQEKQDLMLQKRTDFETKMRELEAQLREENTLSEEEREILKAEKEIEKRELELEQLKLNAEEELALKLLLEKIEKEELDKINKKYRDKEIQDDAKANQKILEDKKRLNNDILNSAIQLAGQESRVGQALLAYKGLLAAKESLIDLGILKAKVATNTGKATADIAAGQAKTASVGFPQNIPLLIGFGLQVAGIISSIKNAAGAGKTAGLKGMNDGGFTPDKAIGNDTYGPITSFNHGNEYVVPAIIRTDPTYAPILNKLETARTQKLDLPPTTSTTNQPENNMLTEAVFLLIEKLSEPILATTFIGDDEIERQNTRQTKISKSRTNARIKS